MHNWLWRKLRVKDRAVRVPVSPQEPGTLCDGMCVVWGWGESFSNLLIHSRPCTDSRFHHPPPPPNHRTAAGLRVCCLRQCSLLIPQPQGLFPGSPLPGFCAGSQCPPTCLQPPLIPFAFLSLSGIKYVDNVCSHHHHFQNFVITPNRNSVPIR